MGHLKQHSNNSMDLKTGRNNRPFTRKVHNLLQQRHPRDLQKETEVVNWLYALGMDLKSGRSENDFSMLEKLESYISKVEQSYWSLN